jgi:hypothetical protein
VASIRHSRVGGNPGDFDLDSRLRGSDIHFATYFWDTTLEVVSKTQIRFKSPANFLTDRGQWYVFFINSNKAWSMPAVFTKEKYAKIDSYANLNDKRGLN